MSELEAAVARVEQIMRETNPPGALGPRHDSLLMAVAELLVQYVKWQMRNRNGKTNSVQDVSAR